MKFRNLKLPRLIHKGNWKIILYSIIGASTFWFFNALNKDYTANIKQPIEFLFDRDGLVIVSIPEDVNVNVSGGGWNLLRKTSWFNVEPIQIRLESPTTTKVMVGASLRPLLSDQLDELKVNFVNSDTLFFDIQNRKEKTIPVWVDSTQLDMRNGFRLVTPITASPDSVTISGPEEKIDSYPDTMILSISEERIDEDFDNEVDVPDLPRQVRSNPDEIEIAFSVRRFVNRNKEIIFEWSGFPEDSSITLSGSRIELIYRVNEELEENIPDSLFSMTAYFEDINPEDSTIIPRLEAFPSFVEPVGVDSAIIKVLYE